MIKVYFSSTNIYTGKTYEEVLTQMMEDDWTEYNSLQDFIKNLQRRIALVTDTIVPLSNAKAVVHALHDIGIAIKIEGGE